MSNTDLSGEKHAGVFTTLMDNGSWMFRKGEYDKAIDNFTTALTLKPKDKHCFVGRSKCYLRIGQLENALGDAEASLKEDQTFHEGWFQKGEALYYMAEFEFALMSYHRGQKLRPQMHSFRLGIQKAQKAIENSVGNHCSVKLEIKGDLSFFKEDESAQPIDAIMKVTDRKQQKKAKPGKTSKTQLGEFDYDKKLLEDLMKDEDLVKRRTKEGEQLHDVIQSCLTYLNSCSDFWKQEKSAWSHTKQSQEKPEEQDQVLQKCLDDIEAERSSGNPEGSLKKAEETLKVVQKWSEREVPDKKEVLSSLHSCIGNACIDLGDMERALKHYHKDLELAKHCKSEKAISRALENIGRVYKNMGQFEQAAEVWAKKIPFCHGGLEKTWLFHEIGCCYLQLNYHEEARDYGCHSAAAADEIAHEKWQMNASILVAQSEFNLGNIESCVSHFERALTLAKNQEDDSAICAIEKVLHEAKEQLPQ